LVLARRVCDKRISINNSSIKSDKVDRASVLAVSKAINGINKNTGLPNGFEARLRETQDAAIILMDDV